MKLPGGIGALRLNILYLFGGRQAVARGTARRERIQRGPETVEVRSVIDSFAGHLLGRKEEEVANDVAGAGDSIGADFVERLGKQQVAELRQAVAPPDQNVGGRDISVDDVGRGSKLERPGDVHRHAVRL